VNLFYWTLIGIGVVTLITFLIALKVKQHNFWYDGDDVATAVLISLVVSSLILGFLWAMVPLSFDKPNVGDDGVSEMQRDTYDLRALNLEGEEYSRSSAAMFLLIGSGSSESGTYEEIQYIKRDADGGMTVQSVGLDESRVFEEDANTEPYVEVIYYEYDNSWYAPWTHGHYLAWETRYEFHVPAGTVVQEFDLDITAE
jgi:hypothetical protein